MHLVDNPFYWGVLIFTVCVALIRDIAYKALVRFNPELYHTVQEKEAAGLTVTFSEMKEYSHLEQCETPTNGSDESEPLLNTGLCFKRVM